MRKLFLLFSLIFAPLANALQLDIGQQQLTNLTMDEQGYLQNVGSDGYLSFRDLEITRAQACYLKLDLEFKKPMQRAGIFELFWHAPGKGFSERTKAFVIINQSDTRDRTQYVVPLCKLFHFSGNINQSAGQGLIGGLRIDYPANRTLDIKFHSIELLDSVSMDELSSADGANIKVLEPYERVNAKAFTSLDVALPKLYFAAEEGVTRLGQDKPFLIVWLLMIAGILMLIIRSLIKERRRA